MKKFFPKNADQSLREKLIAIIRSSDVEFDGELEDDTSLFMSGKLDSLGLFNVVLFIEHEISVKLDITSFDPTREWDTVAEILIFIAKRRTK